MTRTPYLHRASKRRKAKTAPPSLTVAQVAKAYHATGGTGKGQTIGLIELGGGFDPKDFPGVVAVGVYPGGSNTPDGPNGADGEVQLDIEVAQQAAPGAKIRVYFAPNTNDGFLAAFKAAFAECTQVSCSWGGPESSWDVDSMDAFDKAFTAAKAKGINVFCASGDSGADDSTSKPVADFPASSPHVVACGGTRLILDDQGERASEVAWDDNDKTSASGGGVSQHFPGRQVPDVAGNADPVTGYQVSIDGEDYVIGGTSAVAPLYAALTACLAEQYGPFDLLATVSANPSVCYDVTIGDNGAYRAGPGRDDVTGLGVVDFSLLAAKLGAVVPPVDPTPPAPPAPPDPEPVEPPSPTGRPIHIRFTRADYETLRDWSHARHVGANRRAAQAWQRGVS